MERTGLTSEELAELKEAVRSLLSWEQEVTDDELRRMIEEELFRRERTRRMTAAQR